MCVSRLAALPGRPSAPAAVVTEEKGKQSVKWHNMPIKMLSLCGVMGNRYVFFFFPQ